jgi:uncharacterized membrane protein
MEQKEIIFLAIVLIAYIICAFTLDIPAFINYIFLAILLIAILLTVLAKYSKKSENRRIAKTANILALIFLAIYIICAIHEMIYKKALFVDSAVILIPFFGCLAAGWFFKKEE